MNFREFLTFSSVKFFQKSKFKVFKIVKIAVFDLVVLKSANINFKQNQSSWKIAEFPQAKSEWQKKKIIEFPHSEIISF